MMPARRGRAVVAATAAVLAAALVAPAAASECSAGDCLLWEASTDGGLAADDVGRFIGASPTRFNNPETVFLTGSAAKPSTLSSTGIHDLDVLTAAYDAATGAPRWESPARFDNGFSADSPAGLEVNHNNNLIYVPINSGSSIVTAEYAIRDGDEISRWVFPGGRASDSSISQAGGFMGITGSASGDFLVLSYATGMGTLEMQDRPVRGEGLAADISPTGALSTIRTLLVTGRAATPGTGGDVFTAAYNYRTHTKLWQTSWGSNEGRRDEGVVAEAAHVSALGRGVGFIAGRSFSTERGWDIVVTAYDLSTGASLWQTPGGVVTFDGAAHRDDEPVALAYSDATSTLYLTGNSDRGVPHGSDVLTVAFDAATGRQTGIAYASGTVGNGDDAARGLDVSADGSRVFVSAALENGFSNGGRQVGLIAYDALLHPAGSAVFGAAGSATDLAAGVVLGLDDSRVFLAGSSPHGTTGYDFRVNAYDPSAFHPLPVATDLAFTDASATSAGYGDLAAVEARLQEAESGRTLAGRSVTFTLAGASATATTDGDGIARAVLDPRAVPGTYTLEATFAGEGILQPAEARVAFEIVREDTVMTLVVSGTGSRRVLTARLADADDGSGIGGRPIAFYGDGDPLGTATTTPDGVATLSLDGRFRGGSHTFVADFAGDDLYLGSTASASS